jgi:DUF1680 family protein
LSKGIIKSAAFDLNGQWSPWYTLHKTFGGLRDAYRYVENRTALDVEVKFAAWAEGVLSPLSDAQLQQMLNTEFGGMNEVLADLYADTGDRRWLALSHKFDHRAVLDPLVHGEDRLNGLHGNTQVPKLLGSAARYAYTGDRDDRSAATFFWDRVVGHHTFATGGHGKDEYFREPDQLGRIIDGRTAETCNVYNMLKLTRRIRQTARRATWCRSDARCGASTRTSRGASPAAWDPAWRAMPSTGSVSTTNRAIASGSTCTRRRRHDGRPRAFRSTWRRRSRRESRHRSR